MSDENGTFSYDRVAYPSPVLEGLWPDRLRSSAMLHGFAPPDALTSSLLEIGCGDGINAIAWAAGAPRARAVGFDLSESAIARGRGILAETGLTNVELHVGDIMTWPRDGEKFDYIVSHGVLSWVPETVRDGLLELIAARLAPGGVAYLSYDSLPGAAPKAAIVPFLRSRVSETSDPLAAMHEAAAAVDLLNRSIAGDSRLRPVIDMLMDIMQTSQPGYFFHDWLAEHYEPIEPHRFMRRAAANNLRIAGSASNYDVNLVELDPEARDLLAAYGDDHALRLAAIDLLQGPYLFQRNLLVRIDAPPPPVTDAYRGLTYSYDGHREITEDKDGWQARYYFNDTVHITTRNAGTRAVMDLLYESRPAELSYDEIGRRTGIEEPALRDIVLGTCRSNFVLARTTPPSFTLTPGERPLASPLARAMARHGSEVIGLRGAEVDLEQDLTRLLIQLSDGTRTRSEIAAAMSTSAGKEVPLAMVDGAVDFFARRRLYRA